MAHSDAYIENRGPTALWSEGGKQECLARAGIQMTHDELLATLPAGSAQQIEAAGFTLVPLSWRREAMAALLNLPEEIERLRAIVRELYGPACAELGPSCEDIAKQYPGIM